MIAYIVRRLLLIPPTLFGILLLNFTIVQFAPGGPVEQVIARLQSDNSEGASTASAEAASYRGAEGLDPKLVKEIEKQFGFDRPPLERFGLMIGNYLRFDLGESYFRGERVASLIWRKLPTSLALALSATLIAYLVSVPLGIAKAVRDGSRFDLVTSLVIVFAYAVPSYLFAVLMIEFLAGGSYLQVFPLRGLTSDGWAMLPWWRKPLDLGWHLILPVTALVAGSFARPTLLTKNAFIEEIGKQYVATARAKGLTPTRVLYGHVFRNAILVVAVGFPGAFLRMLFVGALLIEIIFSLDGMGLLGFESVVTRDYPVVFGTLYIFTLVGLLVNILTDIVTMAIDPRIDFAGQGGLMAALTVSPITRRRLALFRQNRRGYWSAIILGILLLITLPAEFIANDRPLAVSYAGFLYFPVLKDYPETTFGGDFETYADYSDIYLKRQIQKSGWMLWPLIPFSYGSPVTDLDIPAPAPPSARNWLGTDDQQRDVLAWLIYSLRTSLLFGVAVAALCSVIGVLAGSVEGFFGGWVDLILQRLTEIWVGLPVLFLLIIMASIVTPTFWNLFLLVSVFAWMPLAQLVRAEVLRVRALDYVRAGRALGLGPAALMLRHMLPNALVATFSYLPFELTGAIATLAALDLIGYGMPPGAPSLGTLLNEGRTNLQAPWLGLTGFFTLAIVLTLLTFLGEAVRDAFDPRRQLDRPSTPELP